MHQYECILTHQFIYNYAAHLRQRWEGDAAANRNEETQEKVERTAASAAEGRKQVTSNAEALTS